MVPVITPALTYLLSLLSPSCPDVSPPQVPSLGIHQAVPRQVVGRVTDPRLAEASGLAASAAHPGLWWTVNDSGGEPVVFGLRAGGEVVATLALEVGGVRGGQVQGAVNTDWEAVEVAPCSG
jgi:hypothetical protein